MAGNYRSKGSTVASSIAKLAGAVHDVKTVDKKKKYIKKENESKSKARIKESLAKAKGKSDIRVKETARKGAIKVKTEKGVQNAKTAGKLARKPVSKGKAPSKSANLKGGKPAPKNDMAVGKKKEAPKTTKKKVTPTKYGGKAYPKMNTKKKKGRK